MCINLKINDYNDNFVAVLVGILKHIKRHEPSGEDIWEIARESQVIPHIGNIYLSLMCDEIKFWCQDNGFDFDGYVNAMDSHLCVNGETIRKFDHFLEAIKPENNQNLSINQRLILAAGLEVIEDSDQEGMYCWIDSDISYVNKMMAEDALARLIINTCLNEVDCTQEDWDKLDTVAQFKLVRSTYAR